MSDAWVPVNLSARHVRVGDVFYSTKTQDLWMVTAIEDRGDRPARLVTVQHGSATHTVALDVEQALPVLAPTPERDALRACRNELGARLVSRG